MVHDSLPKIQEKPLFIFWGKVIGGKKRGKILGFPTANIALHKNIPDGIYAARVKVHRHSGKHSSSRIKEGSWTSQDDVFLAATFIGAAKTFGEKEKKSESFLLDFQGDLYGRWVTVRLYKKLRKNKTFASSEDLKKQMKEDIQQTKEFFLHNL